MKTIQWDLSPFEALSPFSLYEILRLRSQIFVLEQNCLYEDMDGFDNQSLHLCGHIAGTLATYCRIIPPGVRYEQPSIGRIVVALPFRGKGYGRELLKKALLATTQNYEGNFIRIQAQAHLEKFYETFGFKRTGTVYLEDGIPHIDMEKEIISTYRYF